jgi:hypothetical protein
MQQKPLFDFFGNNGVVSQSAAPSAVHFAYAQEVSFLNQDLGFSLSQLLDGGMEMPNFNCQVVGGMCNGNIYA